VFDQEMARVRDHLPRMWWSVYQGCREAGFSETQSMALLQTFILSLNTGGIRPPHTDGPPADEDK
jgi:hypothetical protein